MTIDIRKYNIIDPRRFNTENDAKKVIKSSYHDVQGAFAMQDTESGRWFICQKREE